LAPLFYFFFFFSFFFPGRFPISFDNVLRVMVGSVVPFSFYAPSFPLASVYPFLSSDADPVNLSIFKFWGIIRWVTSPLRMRAVIILFTIQSFWSFFCGWGWGRDPNLHCPPVSHVLLNGFFRWGSAFLFHKLPPSWEQV